MFKNTRVKLIKEIVELNERLIFNRRLKKFYTNEISGKLNLILDVGVNTGQSIDIFRKINNNCTIIGFEPNPTLFKALNEKFSKDPKITLSQMGISNKTGKKTFYENILHSTSSFEELNQESKYLAKKANILGVKKENIIANSYQVNVTTLSEYINSFIKTKIDLIKIDTEGHEYFCLEGLFNKTVNVEIGYIQIEEHNDDMYLNKKSFAEIEELLKVNGYSVEAKIKHGFGNFQEVIFKKNKNE